MSKVKQYNSLRFFNIIINTDASVKSTVEYDQYLTYSIIIHQILINKTTEGAVNIKFSIETTSSVSSIRITTLIRKAEFYIVLTDTLFLLSITDMDRLNTYLDNTHNILVTPQREVTVV